MFQINLFFYRPLLLLSLQAVDAGDSIFVHTFGAYFGLAVSYVLDKKKRGSEVNSTLEGSSYTSDLFAMIGKYGRFPFRYLDCRRGLQIHVFVQITR